MASGPLPKSKGPSSVAVGYGNIAANIRANSLKDVAAFVKKFGFACIGGLGEAAYEEATAIIEDAQENYVPYRSGALHDSGRVSDLILTETGATVQFGFGRPGMPHAVAVHEHQGQYDPPTWQGKRVKFTFGGPKYLERPVFAAIPGMGPRLVKRAKKYMGI